MRHRRRRAHRTSPQANAIGARHREPARRSGAGTPPPPRSAPVRDAAAPVRGDPKPALGCARRDYTKRCTAPTWRGAAAESLKFGDALASRTMPQMSPDAAAMLAAASSAIDAGQLAQAEALCRNLLEAQPANGTAKLLLARGRRLGGDFESAAALAEEAARQMPKDPGPRLEAALAYAAGRHFVKAEAAARKALRLRPGFVP